MSKRLGGTVTFVGHRGSRRNPPLLTFTTPVLIQRGIAVGAGGVLYFGGSWAIDKGWTTANPYVAEGVLGAAGLALGFGMYKFTGDKWAGILAGAIPVGMAAFRIVRGIYNKVPFSGTEAATSVPGKTGGASAGRVIGSDVYDDSTGQYMGRVIDSVEDEFGRVIGHMLDDGEYQTFVSGGQAISRVPIALDKPVLAGISRIPLAVDSDVLARVPAGA